MRRAERLWNSPALGVWRKSAKANDPKRCPGHPHERAYIRLSSLKSKYNHPKRRLRELFPRIARPRLVTASLMNYQVYEASC
jgi:hypothetical protein